MPEAGRAANQFARTGHLEALGYGLFGLLHGKAKKADAEEGLGKGKMPAMVSIRNLHPITSSSNAEKLLTRGTLW